MSDINPEAVKVLTSELCREFQIPIEFIETPKIRDERKEKAYARLVKSLQEGLHL